MDEITKSALYQLADANPGCAIRLSHQFLDGWHGRECGFVPHDWNGNTLFYNGKWWMNANI